MNFIVLFVYLFIIYYFISHDIILSLRVLAEYSLLASPQQKRQNNEKERFFS